MECRTLCGEWPFMSNPEPWLFATWIPANVHSQQVLRALAVVMAANVEDCGSGLVAANRCADNRRRGSFRGGGCYGGGDELIWGLSWWQEKVPLFRINLWGDEGTVTDKPYSRLHFFHVMSELVINWVNQILSTVPLFLNNVHDESEPVISVDVSVLYSQNYRFFVFLVGRIKWIRKYIPHPHPRTK